MKCEYCGKIIERKSNSQKYCKECAIKIKRVYNKMLTRHKRWKKRYKKPLHDKDFPVNNEALIDFKNRYSLHYNVPEKCPFCGCTEFYKDDFHGEIVCENCGSVIEKMYSHM